MFKRKGGRGGQRLFEQCSKKLHFPNDDNDDDYNDNDDNDQDNDDNDDNDQIMQGALWPCRLSSPLTNPQINSTSLMSKAIRVIIIIIITQSNVYSSSSEPCYTLTNKLPTSTPPSSSFSSTRRTATAPWSSPPSSATKGKVIYPRSQSFFGQD